MSKVVIQVAKNTHEIIVDYFMTTKKDITKEEAQSFYDLAIEVGKTHGVDAFDESISLVLNELMLSASELSRLTSK